jgi:hypothetical protein
MRPYEWRTKSRKAILETDPFLIEQKLADAEGVVVARIRELFHETGAKVELERDALDDAMYALRALKHTLELKTRGA